MCYQLPCRGPSDAGLHPQTCGVSCDSEFPVSPEPGEGSLPLCWLPGKVLGVRLLQPRPLMVNLWGSNGKASRALSSWWDGKTPRLLP